ncbi:MAG: TonB-dependent receptor [Rhodothermales bacterium]
MGASAQTGKIAGTVRDASTGEALPGVNVVIDGTTQGAVTDLDGFYNIINVRPGTYAVRASFVGYTAQLVEGVQVSTGLTATIDFNLSTEQLGLDEVVVTAERPVVELDVSANVANLTAEDIVDLPVAGVSEVLDLQAGIEPGLSIRGGGVGEVAFIVDGMNMRTGRSNEPITNVSYTSVEAVQVQTGGFNAEYGNVRSGIVNVSTKEPSRNRYTFDGLFRYRPAQAKAFDGLPEDPDGFYMRGWSDPAIQNQGTSALNPYEARQYNSFVGLDALATAQQANGFDVTSADMLEYLQYAMRKDNTIDIGDYETDFTVGGPLLPGMGNKLGGLRFLASYRGTQTAYMFPQVRNSYHDQNITAKLVSNIAPGMKITVSGMSLMERGINRTRGESAIADIWRGTLPAYPWTNSGVVILNEPNERGLVHSNGAFNRANIDHKMIGAEFVHTINANTFYTITGQYLTSKYRTPFADLRDGTTLVDGQLVSKLATRDGNVVDQALLNELLAQGQALCVGGDSDITGDGNSVPYCIGQEPFNYAGGGGNILGTGITTGGHWDKARDSSSVGVFTGRFDLTSQVNRFLQVKTGAEVIASDYNMNYKHVNLELVGPTPEASYLWDRNPIQGAAYVQSKLEFNGMIANLGLRLDYFDANTEWWDYTPYDSAFRGTQQNLNDVLSTRQPDPQVELSPRLGISFPITSNSKLYFNYGHFRQMLEAFNVFGVQERTSSGIDVIGNPDHPMPKTVAYELGYDQNLFDQFLVRVSGFYRDLRDQPRSISYTSLGNVVQYNTLQPWNYEDIRGAEFTLTKNRGRWVRGFLNYTFLTTKNGNFGYQQFYENSFDQRNYLRNSTDFRITAPVAQPFARMNVTFLTPPDFKQDVAGGFLANWRVNLLGEWRKGEAFIWSNRGNFPELDNNVRWKDYWMFDLRFTKHINTNFGNAQIFADISNVFNIRHLSRYTAFYTQNADDFEFYMRSLHLPGDIYQDLRDQTALPYLWIPGSDQPGDFRKNGIAFQPIETTGSLSGVSAPNTTAWYWAQDTGNYSRWNGSAWEAVPEGDVKKALDDKAYIDMPNMRFASFLNPRAVTFGVRVSF